MGKDTRESCELKDLQSLFETVRLSKGEVLKREVKTVVRGLSTRVGSLHPFDYGFPFRTYLPLILNHAFTGSEG